MFEEEDAADRAAADPKHTFGEREVCPFDASLGHNGRSLQCDIKKAVPQSRRFNPRFGGPMGGGAGPMRGGYGMRPMHSHGGGAPWYGGNGGQRN